MKTLFIKINVAILLLLCGFFLQATSVSAATFSVSGGTYASVNLDAGSYTAGSSMYITGAIYTAGAYENAAYLSASTSGSTAEIINVATSVGSWVYGTATLSVPSSAGSYAVSFIGGIHAPDMPTITSAYAGARPYVGGSVDDHIECNVNLNGPVTVDSNINMSYRLRNSYSPSDYTWGSCGVPVYAGYSNGVDNGTYYGEWLTDYYVDYTCVDYSDGPIIGSNVAC